MFSSLQVKPGHAKNLLFILPLHIEVASSCAWVLREPITLEVITLCNITSTYIACTGQAFVDVVIMTAQGKPLYCGAQGQIFMPI
jgi:hypothetical protein